MFDKYRTEVRSRFYRFAQVPAEFFPIHREIAGSLTGAVLLAYLLRQFDGWRDKFWHTDAQVRKFTSLSVDELKRAKANLAELPFIRIERKGLKRTTHYELDLAALDEYLEQYPDDSDSGKAAIREICDSGKASVITPSDNAKAAVPFNELKNSKKKKEQTTQAAAEGRLRKGQPEDHPLLAKVRGKDGAYHMGGLTEKERDILWEWERDQEEKEEREYAKRKS